MYPQCSIVHIFGKEPHVVGTPLNYCTSRKHHATDAKLLKPAHAIVVNCLRIPWSKDSREVHNDSKPAHKIISKDGLRITQYEKCPRHSKWYGWCADETALTSRYDTHSNPVCQTARLAVALEAAPVHSITRFEQHDVVTVCSTSLEYERDLHYFFYWSVSSTIHSTKFCSV